MACPVKVTKGCREMAQELIDAGVPVVVCRPNRSWRPGESHELWMPSGWHVLFGQ